MQAAYGNVANSRFCHGSIRVAIPGFNLLFQTEVSRVIRDDDFTGGPIKILFFQRFDASRQKLRTLKRGNYNGHKKRRRGIKKVHDWVVSTPPRLSLRRAERRSHRSLTERRGRLRRPRDDIAGTLAWRGFLIKKDPIASASSGEVQKLSKASLGVQTIGSPRVLNE